MLRINVSWFYRWLSRVGVDPVHLIINKSTCVSFTDHFDSITFTSPNYNSAAYIKSCVGLLYAISVLDSEATDHIVSF